jgi:tetratricopeptide (TPR) repeat protein
MNTRNSITRWISVSAAAAFLLTQLFVSSCGSSAKNDEHKYDSLPLELRALSQKIDKDPRNGELYYTRAEYYFLNKKMDSAVKDMKRAIETDLNKAKYHIRLSDYYFAMNQTRGTRDELLQAIHGEPKNTDALLKLGELYYLVKNYDTAVFYINRSIAADPDNAKAYFQKGMALKEIGDSSNAVSAFQSSVEKDPKSFEGYIQLANIYGAHKDPLAVQYYNTALQLQPNDPQVLYGLGLFYQNMGDSGKARKTYEDLLKVDPKNVYAVYNLGYISLVLENDPKKARPFFDKAIMMQPEYADAVYMRGLCYEKMGDKKNAAADYNAALVIEPEHQLSIYGLKRLAGKK